MQEFNNISYNNNNNVIRTISRHIQDPGICNTWATFENPAYWDPWHSENSLFRHIQGQSAISSLVQAYRETIGYIEAYLGIIEAYESYSDIFRTLCNPYIYNRDIFRTLVLLEPDVSSQPCGRCKMIRHIESPGIVRTVYSSISNDI